MIIVYNCMVQRAELGYPILNFDHGLPCVEKHLWNQTNHKCWWMDAISTHNFYWFKVILGESVVLRWNSGVSCNSFRQHKSPCLIVSVNANFLVVKRSNPKFTSIYDG